MPYSPPTNFDEAMQENKSLYRENDKLVKQNRTLGELCGDMVAYLHADESQLAEQLKRRFKKVSNL